MDYLPALAALKAAISRPERPAVFNRQEINPPCVFMALRGFDTWTVCGAAEAGVHLWVCVGDRSDEAALEALAPELDAVLSLLDAAALPIEAVAADQILGTDSSTPYPAFRIETHLSL